MCVPGRHDGGVSLAQAQAWSLFQASLRQQEQAREEDGAGSQDAQHGSSVCVCVCVNRYLTTALKPLDKWEKVEWLFYAGYFQSYGSRVSNYHSLLNGLRYIIRKRGSV